MFDRLIVRPQRPYDDSNPLDLGALVEAMLFYGHTELVISPGVVQQLARAWKPEGLIELAEEGLLQFTFVGNFAGIETKNSGSGAERYKPVVFDVERNGRLLGLEHSVPDIFESVCGRRGRAHRLAARFCRHVSSSPLDAQLAARVETDVLDGEYMAEAARRALIMMVPDYPMPEVLRFDVQRLDDGLRVLTTIDFALANSLYHRTVPPEHSTLTPAHVLAQILGAREALESAAAANAELSADPIRSALLALKLDSAIARYSRNQQRISSFQSFVLDSGRAVRETINSGERGIDDIIAVLKHARKFKGWLAGQPLDSDIVQQYIRASTEQTWIDKAPAKSLRWLVFTGAGLAFDAMGAGGIGTAVGVGASAVDSFFVDTLLRGWRPSQFVEQRLRPFTN